LGGVKAAVRSFGDYVVKS